MTTKPLKMSFSPKTIEHLGVQLYHTMPPVIAELVANAYDADAENVKIYLRDKQSHEIIIEDDGCGMLYEELESKFLKIGRNRREEGGQTSRSKKRNIIGKKGLGKLSFFGIADHIEITTKKDCFENSFALDLKKIKQSKNEYTTKASQQPCP